MTRAEKILWNALRTIRLGGFHFRRQQVIDGFIVDFYFHSVGLVIELDGGVHNLQMEYDIERDKVITARGLEIIRIPNQSVIDDLQRVLNHILLKCENRSTSPT